MFLTLLAALCTGIGYHFGFGNQTEALPIIERFRDASFLKGDFFVDSGSEFGPRFYYAGLIALLSRVASVPTVMLALAFLANLGVAAVSHCAARDLLRADRLTGWVAATLSVCVSGFALGLVADLRFVDFQPGSLAIPWALAGLWLALLGKPIQAGLLSSIALIWHPLYGLETGALSLASAAVRALSSIKHWSLRSLFESLWPSALGGVILGMAAVLLWAVPSHGASEPPLTTAEVVDILARFRAPHHYLPSTFPVSHYVAFLAFVLASALTFRQFWLSEQRQHRDLAFLVAPVLILLGCLLGYLLVEVHPTQALATAQPFRLLYIFKWQGFLLAAWLIVRLWRSAGRARCYLALSAFAGTAAAQPGSFLLAALASGIEARFGQRGLKFAQWLTVGAALLTVPLVLLLGSRDELYLLGCASVLLALFHGVRSPSRRSLAAFAFAALVIGLLATNHALHFSRARALSPVLSFDDHLGDDAEAARWIRAQTSQASLFVIPPGLGSFRLIAQRNVVVDFKSLPFGATAMRSWYHRMLTLYGPVSAGGFAALRQMDQNYARISDAQLTRAAQEFGAAYALLYTSTVTARTVVYRNSTYQVVLLGL